MSPGRLPWVVSDYCEGCTSCVAACSKGCLMMRESGEDDFVPWLDAPEQCTGCGRCEDACGLGGIVMTEYVEEAARRFLERPHG